MLRVKSNPLSTRYVQPGRIPWYAVDSNQSITALANCFTNQLNCRAAIVGPHGSGKSTLLAHLVPLLGAVAYRRAAYASSIRQDDAPGFPMPQDAGHSKRSIVWLEMRGSAASARLLSETQPQWCQPDRLLVVDGYEQLSLFSRAWLVWRTRRHRVGLLVTSHRRTSLPTLIATQVNVELALQLLDHLLPPDLEARAAHLNSERLSQLLTRHHGNLREVFMQLYDEIE